MLPPHEIVQIEIAPGWWLSSERALYLASERTLVVADIHWGYAQSHRQAGNLLPMWGDEEIAFRLNRLISYYQPARMIWLGDSLHTPTAADFAEAFLKQIEPLEVIIISGNHDRSWKKADRKEFHLGSLVFHHGDTSRKLEEGGMEVIGHIHPTISLSDGAGLRLKVHALVQGHRRLILPSFSEWSSGAAWNNRLEEDEKVWLISSRRIWSLSHGQLIRPDQFRLEKR
jgi:DNA ligase-associated metallophosphoesterase